MWHWILVLASNCRLTEAVFRFVELWQDRALGRGAMSISVFLSTVSDEFRSYRDQLVHDLTRHNVSVKVQEDFKDLGGDTLDKLDVYIAHCDAVVHLVGDMCGSAGDERQQQALLLKHSNLQTKLPPLGEVLNNGVCLPYTQWEAWLALYYGKPLLIAKAAAGAPRGPKYAPDDASRASQAEHLKRLKAFHRYPSSEFGGPDELAKQIAYTAILDLLVKDYAEKFVQQRDVAEGFIREMAKRVAGDKALDLDGMKQAVRNAIEIYEKEIAGRPVETNLDDIVSRALARAKEQVDRGQSGLARETLRRAADEMRRDEQERRERFEGGVTALYTQARDIALAAYDGDAAAEAIVELARTIYGANEAKIMELLGSEAQALYEHGRDRGSNVHLVAAVASRREQLRLAISDYDRGTARVNLGNVLETLGERESGTAKLEEAIAAYREALEERTRERVPLDWARTQGNLGNALMKLGERVSGTEYLDDAVTAYRAALEELTRERIPLDWARTQNNLGTALQAFGEREGGTARLAAAVKAYRTALQEFTREQVPFLWAPTQNNLGNALRTLGERESGTARLEEAVQALREALKERTRERVPLQWATTQDNLGNALTRLGERETGTARLLEAVQIYRAALEERTRDRVPLLWAATQSNLGHALWRLGERVRGTALLDQAVDAHLAALKEWTRERFPLLWGRTQNNLGNALKTLGELESGTARLDEAVAAYRAALEELTRERVPLEWAQTQNNLGATLHVLGEREPEIDRLQEAVKAYGEALKERTPERVPLEWGASVGNRGVAMMLIAGRTNDGAMAESAFQQIQTAVETLRSGGQDVWAAVFEAALPKAQAMRDRLKGQ